MCKIVYLTSPMFDSLAGNFCKSLKRELTTRGIEVVTSKKNGIFTNLKRHKTYGIALAFDFYKDDKDGSGLVLNRYCSAISRDFAYQLSNDYDKLTPFIRWREVEFVDSDDKEWRGYFNKVSAYTKAIFHLCSINRDFEKNNFFTEYENIIKIFADEIERCLQSEYNSEDYRKSIIRKK